MMIAIYDSDGISLSRRTESQIRFVVTFMRRVLKKSTQLNVFPKVHLLSFIGTFDLNLMYT